MTLSEMSDFVCSKVNKTDAASISLCKGYLRSRYEVIYDSALWKDTLMMINIAATSHQITIPFAIEHVVALRWNKTEILPVDASMLFRIDPEIFERSGTPTRFSSLIPVGVNILPVSETIRLVSSSSSDTAVNVLIRGELAGVEQIEILTLNGITPVTSARSWDLIYTLSKGATLGTITVTGVTSGNTLVTLWDVERERKHARIRLHEKPQDISQNLLILGKRRIRKLTHDLDTPLIRNIDNALIAFATSDMLERERQYGKAQLKIQEGAALLDQAKALHTMQAASGGQLIPDSSGEWNRYDFI